MLKAIFAKHVWAGDSLLLSGGERVEVERIEPGTCTFVLTDGRRVTLNEYDMVGLGHRPWPEGKTEQDMLDAIFAQASLPGRMWPMSAASRRKLDEKLVRLRAALDAYEMGKPEKPPRNESLVDRHMTP